MKKFLFLVIMAAAAVFTVNAQEQLVKTINMYGERPNADSYCDADAATSVRAIEYGSFETDQTITLTTRGVPVEYLYKHDAKQTYLVIRTGQKEEITLWFTDASDKTPKIDWTAATITDKNGKTIKIVYGEQQEETCLVQPFFPEVRLPVFFI